MRTLPLLAVLISLPAAASGHEVFVLPMGQTSDVDATTVVTQDDSNAIWSATIAQKSADFPYYLNTANNAMGTMTVASSWANAIMITRHGTDGTGSPLGFWCGQLPSGQLTDIAEFRDDVYVSGRFSGSATFGTEVLTSSGDFDGFVARFSGTTGNLVWIAQLGGPGFDTVEAVVIDKTYGHVFIAGSFTTSATLETDTDTESLTAVYQEDIVVARLDAATSDIDWAWEDGRMGQERAMALAFEGTDLWVGGRFTDNTRIGGTYHLSSGSTDGFLAKYRTTDGFVFGSVKMGGTSMDAVTGVAVSQSGDIVVGGNFFGTMTVGTDTHTSAGSQDVFMAAFTDTLAYTGSSEVGGGTGFDGINAVAAIGDNAVATGFRYGSGDWGGIPLDVKTTSSGTAGGRYDAFVLHFRKPSPSSSWAATSVFMAGGPGDDFGHDISAHGSSSVGEDAIVSVGRFQRTADWGTFPKRYDSFTSAGRDDGYLWKHYSVGHGRPR